MSKIKPQTKRISVWLNPWWDLLICSLKVHPIPLIGGLFFSGVVVSNLILWFALNRDLDRLLFRFPLTELTLNNQLGRIYWLGFFSPFLLFISVFEIRHTLSFKKEFIYFTRYRLLGWSSSRISISQIEAVGIVPKEDSIHREPEFAIRLTTPKKSFWFGLGLDLEELRPLQSQIIERIGLKQSAEMDQEKWRSKNV